ncbi:MAG: hypothetical protein P9L97_06870 [Candidatus Tenebribacter davisii]|nr:hypothetical protein [Candidatus Tenebribacter davisii]
MYLFEHKIREILIKQNVVIGLRFLLFAILLALLIFNIFFAVYTPIVTYQRVYFLFAISLKIFLALIFIYLGLQANRALFSHLEAAKYLDMFNKDKSDTYQNAFELKRELNNGEILDKILMKADAKAKDQIIVTNTNKLRPILILTVILIFFSGALFLLNPSHFTETYIFFQLKKLPQVNHKEVVEVSPGNLSITRNSKLVLEVKNPEMDIEHKIFYKIEKNWREEKLINYKRTFNNLDFSFSYFIKTPFAVSDTFKITVYELPTIKDLQIRYDYPNYTGLKSEIQKNSSGNVKALIGTIITLNIDANNPIEQAEMFFSNGDYVTMDRTGRSSFRSEFKISTNGTYHFGLKDILDNESHKITRTISAISDKKPEIKITSPGKDTLLTQNMLLPLSIFAFDDYGLKDMQLHYYINHDKELIVPVIRSINSNTITHDHVLNLNKNIMIPGDKVTYWVEISDNSPQGQTAFSQKYTARFPSIEEIYKEIEEKEKEKSNILENTLKKSEKLQKEFEEKRREMMKQNEISWEDKKEIEKLLNKQDNLNDEVEQVAEDFEELLNKFENNDVLSSETMEKMKKIQELMEEISNDEMQEALKKLQERLDSIDPEEMKKAMKDLKFSMEDFSEKIDQTLRLLEDIKKEQSLQKALEIAEEMEEMQNELNKKTDEKSESNEKLAEQQKQISDKLDNLIEQMKAAAELMDDKKDSEILEEMAKLQSMMDQDSLSSDLDESMQNLQNDKMQEAQKSQQQASKKMMKMKQQLQKMQQSMSSGMSVDAAEILEKTIQRLLIFSQYHEAAFAEYTNDPFLILPEEISIFESIDLTIKELYQVPMIILVIGPKFMYDANFTFSSFRELFQYVNDAKTSKVKSYLKDIQKGINLMIYDLMQAKNNMQQGGSGGMQSMMQSLQQMGQQQMMMNMMTQKMMMQFAENGQMSSEMRSQAQKLARDEQRLAENLKRMLQTNPEAQKQTSALNKIIDDMESIAHDLKRGRVDQELVNKQQRILSRLLDAQRSIHKREFSKKRKAETSEIEDWDLPEEIKLKFDKMRKKALLQEDYKDLPQEYQELIQEYLRLLNEKYDDE